MEFKNLGRSLFPAQIKNINPGGLASVLYGLLAAVAAMLLLSFIGSAAVYFSSLNESWLAIFAVIINIIAIFAGGWFAGRKGKNRGLLRGLGVGVLVLLLMLITGNTPLAELGTRLAFCLPAGALGGICGVK